MFEQLRRDYTTVKSGLDKQEIINERLLRATFAAKVKDIHSVGWISSIMGASVIVLSPLVFHYNPSVKFSWAFVIGTDIMMLVCILFNYLFHRDVKAPKAGDDLLTFARKVRKLKADYQGWVKYALVMILGWSVWLVTELIHNLGAAPSTYFMVAGMLAGVLVGGILGYRMDVKVVSRCDEIINSIEEK